MEILPVGRVVVLTALVTSSKQLLEELRSHGLRRAAAAEAERIHQARYHQSRRLLVCDSAMVEHHERSADLVYIPQPV